MNHLGHHILEALVNLEKNVLKYPRVWLLGISDRFDTHRWKPLCGLPQAAHKLMSHNVRFDTQHVAKAAAGCHCVDCLKRRTEGQVDA